MEAVVADERGNMITNHQTGTRVDEVASGIYRICTPLDVIPGGFTFNSYLIADDEPLLFHTGYAILRDSPCPVLSVCAGMGYVRLPVEERAEANVPLTAMG